MARNADRTRAKILSAAVSEFSANGYAGARIDRIASRAGANKRLIYHHFGGKQAVFEAVLAEQLTTASANDELVRLWMYEALERGDDDIVGFAERRKLAAERVAAASTAQGKGDLPAEVDPALLATARLALDVFPLAFPQLVRIVMGDRATSNPFREAWNEFLNDWHGPRTPDRAKPRVRLDRDGIARAATRPRRTRPTAPSARRERVCPDPHRPPADADQL
ncbi:MAG: helix-turn-helix transcriptional regulator [Gammaproteobacteria bacterium]|nr:helix-turn-helix transcriptional regulator [Gammaproteobacteria bacterium]MYJ73914.1 helix-turn-helix transcriptional regulator [Gammaproteobacteria bacterium]